MTLSRRHLLAGLGMAAAVPLAGCMSTQPVSAADLPPLTAALREGGHVVYFRHAATQWSGIDRIEWPRERQRLLSDEGVAQAEAIGAAWRAAGVPVGEVWASPFARCSDHARISFGRVHEDMRLIGLLSDDTGRPERVAFLRGLVTDPPAPGTNRVIVSHRSNIAEVAGVTLAEGEGVVLRPDRVGTFDIVDTRMPDGW